MVLPILPLIDDLASWGAKKAYASLVGQVLLDGSNLNKDEIVQFAKEEEVPLVTLSLPNAKFSDDEIIAFLNNGVSSLFIASQDAKIVDHLIEELNVPKNRIVVEENSVFYNQFLVKQKFSQDRIVSIKDLTKDLLIKEVIAEVRTDRPDGLFTTLVVDQYERCLGLVYSSKESIAKAIELGRGVYYSRSRNEIWVKGETSGNGQKLLQISTDCDSDALKFIVEQENVGFCHLETMSCFGEFKHGLVGLESLLKQRLQDAPKESYTRRLFNDSALLDAKIKEEAEELTEAKGKQEISWEAADLFYFALAKLVANNVSLKDVENNLNMKHLKITRRKGDAKPKFVEQAKVEEETPTGPIHLHVVNASDKEGIKKALSRPIQKTSEIMHLVNPIIENVRDRGDSALLEYTEKFDGVKLSTPVLNAPFPEEYFEGLTEEMKDALDLSIENVRKFHAAQLPKETLEVETQPGVLCSRFPRPIEKVGLYIPGGTAILPSTALMLGVPAQVAQCKEIIFASPPRKSDGKVSPEVVYVAEKVGASKIVLAGGAQAVAAMAYGTESIPKVDKVLGPGNQFVTAAKMYVQNDTQALCSIDMPAGPSEVLVIADEDADADFVASDLLSQAEHGIDSQVILVGIKLSEEKIQEIQDAVHNQAMQLPRVDIVRKCIAHSTIILCDGYEEALDMSNKYAPEHLILQIANANDYVKLVDNAGSVFVGAYTPESCGDYSSGTNHTLPTYGYARQYSGANTATFQKFITAQNITPEGLENIGRAVMCVAKKEGLDGHRNAVKIRMSKLGLIPKDFQ